MARFKPDPLIPGDQVRDGRRTGVVDRTYPRKSDGKVFLIIKLDSGGSEWPNEGHWLPQIHWSENGLTTRCVECERLFRTSKEENVWCRTCAKAEQTRTDAQIAHAESRSRFASPNWKQEHRRDGGDSDATATR